MIKMNEPFEQAKLKESLIRATGEPTYGGALSWIQRQRQLTEPRGLARCDATALAQLRQIILTVIDDGDIEQTGWYLSGESEQATEARMRFVSTIEAEIIRRTTPAAAKAGDGNGGAR